MRRTFSTMLLPALFLIGMTTLSPAKGKQDAKQDAANASLEERVKALEKLVAEQKEDLAKFARFADGVLIGVGRLGSAADASREHGFESAGPNPLARTDLLEGIKNLEDSVKKSLEKPKDDAAKDGGETPEKKEGDGN